MPIRHHEPAARRTLDQNRVAEESAIQIHQPRDLHRRG